MKSLAHRGTGCSVLAASALFALAIGCSDTHTLAGTEPNPAGSGAGPHGEAGPNDIVNRGNGTPAGTPVSGKGPSPNTIPPTPTRGQPGRGPDVPEPFAEFLARFDGDVIVVDVWSSYALSTWTCGESVVLEKYEPGLGLWSAPRDDRPPDHGNPGYYLDGTFVPPSFNEGCDVQTCIPFPVADNRVVVGPAYEYVKTGTTARPPGGELPPEVELVPTEIVDVIETRPLSGTVRVRIDYFEDSVCGASASQIFELGIPTPELGVCCPIGSAGCSSDGPGGGWAPSFDACSPFEMAWDVMFEQRPDPRGCAELVEVPEVCCGCVVDYDGGI